MMRKFTSSCVTLIALLLAAPASAENLEITVIDSRAEAGLANAVVELLPSRHLEMGVSPVSAKIDQVDKEFIFGVTVVPKGSRVSFPNSDDILHHVYSFSPAKTFDIPLYGADENLDHYETFDKPGIVEIGCNIHDWMLAYIYVAHSDFATKTDEKGLARLEGIAPGNYKVRIWHARMEEHEAIDKDVTVGAGADSSHTISLDLGSERRIRRAPSTARGRYR